MLALRAPAVSWHQAEHQYLVAALRRSLSYYSLIHYTGRRCGPQPIIGIVLIQPGSGLGLVRWKLTHSGILPRSAHWRKIEEYLGLLQEALADGMLPATMTDLDAERFLLATQYPAYTRLVSLSAPCAALGDPYQLVHQIFEEDVMGKATVAVDTEYTYVEEEIMVEPKVAPASSASRALCDAVARLASHMTIDEVEVFMKLLGEQADEDAYPASVALLRRTIDLVMKRAPEKEARQVERIVLASERVVKF